MVLPWMPADGYDLGARTFGLLRESGKLPQPDY
jgi:hypothetical protein